MTHVFNRERTFLDPILRPIERLIYQLDRSQRGARDALDGVRSGDAALQRSLDDRPLRCCSVCRAYLPFNPQNLAGVDHRIHGSFNTASSFTTNTNWQSYVPEVTMSYLTQMAGLAYHNFVSAAVGISLAIAFIRGIARREMETIGNFWVDMTRATALGLLAVLPGRGSRAGSRTGNTESYALRHREARRPANDRSR